MTLSKASYLQIRTIEHIVDDLTTHIKKLSFGPPISHVYNPLIYARSNFVQYWVKFGLPPKEVIFLGMNPGPWGMAQTGIPFGHVELVKTWLGLEGKVGQPEKVHPKRPVQGFDCRRLEVSGERLWGWAKSRFKEPRYFFRQCWVANYCPLVFMEASGRNRTPDKLTRAEKEVLFAACDQALRRTIDFIQPRYVVGVGTFSAQRARIALSDRDVQVEQILHPSPANPAANQNWVGIIEKQLTSIGIQIIKE
jgi:single-strand selective monofunctional uracil DNA glycosylase